MFYFFSFRIFLSIRKDAEAGDFYSIVRHSRFRRVHISIVKVYTYACSASSSLCWGAGLYGDILVAEVHSPSIFSGGSEEEGWLRLFDWIYTYICTYTYTHVYICVYI